MYNKVAIWWEDLKSCISNQFVCLYCIWIYEFEAKNFKYESFGFMDLEHCKFIIINQLIYLRNPFENEFHISIVYFLFIVMDCEFIWKIIFLCQSTIFYVKNIFFTISIRRFDSSHKYLSMRSFYRRPTFPLNHMSNLNPQIQIQSWFIWVNTLSNPQLVIFWVIWVNFKYNSICNPSVKSKSSNLNTTLFYNEPNTYQNNWKAIQINRVLLVSKLGPCRNYPQTYR